MSKIYLFSSDDRFNWAIWTANSRSWDYFNCLIYLFFYCSKVKFSWCNELISFNNLVIYNSWDVWACLNSSITLFISFATSIDLFSFYLRISYSSILNVLTISLNVAFSFNNWELCFNTIYNLVFNSVFNWFFGLSASISSFNLGESITGLRWLID